MSDYNQLKTLKYQNVISDTTSKTKENVDIDKFLEDEKNKNKNASWNKLTKVDKINKLKTFSEEYGAEHKLNESEVKELKTYLKSALDRKRLQNLKEVSYDKETGKIIALTNLSYNKLNKKFTLKNSDKKSSTIKTSVTKKPLTKTLKKKSRDKNMSVNNNLKKPKKELKEK